MLDIFKLNRIYIIDHEIDKNNSDQRHFLAVNKDIILGKNDDNFHYIKSVIRLKEGGLIRCFNENDGEFLSEITQINNKEIRVKILKQIRSVVNDVNSSKKILALCQIKPDNFYLSVKNAVALGVDIIMPIISHNTQQNIKINYDKINKIIIEATKQSERLSIMKIHKPKNLSDFIDSLAIGDTNDDSNILYFANERSDKKPTSSYISNSLSNKNNNIFMLIGPEGGFTKEEKEYIAGYKNCNSISLGNNVLRSELAVVSLISIINYFEKCL